MLDRYLNIVTHPLVWIFIGLMAVFYLVQWSVGRPDTAPTAPDDRIRRLAGTVGLKGLHPALFLILFLTWGIVAGTLFVGLYAILWQVIFHAPPEGSEDVWNWRFTLAQLVALTTVLGAVIALPITINRLILTRRQTDTVEQGHITDRINKAVEGLGAEKTVKKSDFIPITSTSLAGISSSAEIERQIQEFTFRGRPGSWETIETTEPNLEVRIGAIYALERISQDSARDHIQIMEILCAYIRQNVQTRDVPLPEGEPTPKDWREWGAQGRDYPRLDVDVALKVIDRRAEARKQQERNQDYRLGLERAPLRKIILSGRDLTNADLIGAQVQGADLGSAELQGATLLHAELQGANLWFAQLQGAALMHAELQGADLGFAELEGASLWRAQLQGANLGGAQLQGANLGFARLQGANLEGAAFDGDTNLSAATLQGAALRSADYTDIPQLTQHVQDMFGDASVTLPGGQGPEHESWPAHWPTFELNHDLFEEEWRKWQADPETYTPPEVPEEG